MIHGFGDIFRYNEEQYVFLASTDEIVYAARVLDPEKTALINQMNNRRAARHDASRTDGNSLYWYVVLTTNELEECAAHLKDTDQDASRDRFFEWIGKTLNENDITHLKEEILKEGCPIPKGLREIVQTLE